MRGGGGGGVKNAFRETATLKEVSQVKSRVKTCLDSKECGCHFSRSLVLTVLNSNLRLARNVFSQTSPLTAGEPFSCARH